MNFAKTAFDLFYKTFGRRIIKTAADNKWIKNMIQKLKSQASTPKTSDVVKKVREGLKKDKPFHEGFTPKVVKNKWTDKQGQTWMRDKKGNPIQITEGLGKYKLAKAGADAKRKVGDPFKKKVEPSNVIDLKWWKKMKDRGDLQKGGNVDKALPKRSRDI
jgi:hypothetical protein